MGVEIEILREASDDLVTALGRLLPQLSTTAKALDRETVARLLAFEANTVLGARLQGRLVGTLTLVTFPLPSGVRARIEDVVVDEGARGRGVAAALTDKALQLAGEMGARTVDLTSRPSREAANRLYERAGFQRRDSTVYRLELDPAGP
ncbi:GNAT family N-acetyltransferase [Microtetraspora malaysiensis]|uniref:GNAT family N-acetyltransferase n=1 Tax=Microtetraspora malaysiensis TaxID=161358 RepID=UPI00082DB765|nr:GNAT family N-acetyltransferase [Microtetraspora malaysiensis]